MNDFVCFYPSAVLWWYLRNIPGVPEAIKLLEKNGKTIRFVSNNSARPFEEYVEKFAEIEVEIKEENLVHPVLSIIHHLNDIKFKGLIYCIGTEVFKNYLRAAGFDLFDGVSLYYLNYIIQRRSV